MDNERTFRTTVHGHSTREKDNGKSMEIYYVVSTADLEDFCQQNGIESTQSDDGTVCYPLYFYSNSAVKNVETREPIKTSDIKLGGKIFFRAKVHSYDWEYKGKKGTSTRLVAKGAAAEEWKHENGDLSDEDWGDIFDE